MKHILLYNWAMYANVQAAGGGVSVYCKNLIEELSKRDDVKISFLYSGSDYEWARHNPYVRRVRNDLHNTVASYSIVNSPIVAPSISSFNNPEDAISNIPIEQCFRDFLSQKGPFDVVHFNNLEGLSTDCLKVVSNSSAKCVVSLHNYFAVCPQVNLFRRNSAACEDYLDGKACVSCLTERVDREQTVRFRRGISLGLSADVLFLLQKIGKVILRQTKKGNVRNISLRESFERAGHELQARALLYRERRRQIVAGLNRYADVLISVSYRSTEIMRHYGLDEEKLRTIHIGSKAAEFEVPAGNPAKFSKNSVLRLIYMGPSSIEKGLAYLLDQLLRLSDAELKQIELVVASSIPYNQEESIRSLLAALMPSLNRLVYIPGYSFQQIPSLLSGVHLGVVTSLWEDNLPQVTFELLSCKVPVLCSNRGGASEFVGHRDFIFDPGVENDLISKLRRIRENPSLLEEFWQTAKPVRSMKDHLQDLLPFYEL